MLRRRHPPRAFTHLTTPDWVVSEWQGCLPVTPQVIHTLHCLRLRVQFFQPEFQPLPTSNTHRITLSYQGKSTQSKPIYLMRRDFCFEPWVGTYQWSNWAAYQITQTLAGMLIKAEAPTEVMLHERSDHISWWPHVVSWKYKSLLERFPMTPR